MSDVSIVLVGCGAPLKSMGWYHATQILHKDCNIECEILQFRHVFGGVGRDEIGLDACHLCHQLWS
ncbi:hypothetical protein ACHAWU_006354 [Discostella pseudostelligera]|uniref:Uncharacterized protein n=1 Tax=Discostella pseudostelligera TaxID=259834 RepID=A0ABD3M5U0_9STRA